MSKLRETPTYSALIAILPDAEFRASDVIKKGAAAINAIGPFERSEFEPCDVHQMICHLVGNGDAVCRVEESFHESGRLESRQVYYRLLPKKTEPQALDMFGECA